MDHMIVHLIQNSFHVNVNTEQLTSNTAEIEKMYDLQQGILG